MYAEVITNPTHWKALSYQQLIPGILEGFDQAYEDGYTDCRLLVSCCVRRPSRNLWHWCAG